MKLSSTPINKISSLTAVGKAGNEIKPHTKTTIFGFYTKDVFLQKLYISLILFITLIIIYAAASISFSFCTSFPTFSTDSFFFYLAASHSFFRASFFCLSSTRLCFMPIMCYVDCRSPMRILSQTLNKIHQSHKHFDSTSHTTTLGICRGGRIALGNQEYNSILRT